MIPAAPQETLEEAGIEPGTAACNITELVEPEPSREKALTAQALTILT
jgi:hypothetical protein